MQHLRPRTKTVTIAATETESDVLDLDLYQIAALGMPAAWTSADITLKAAPERDGTFLDVYDDEGEKVTIKVAANRVVVIDKGVIATAGLKYVKLVSSVAQDADRTITVIMKG